MATRRMRLQAPCPACGEPRLEYTSTDLDIPHFGPSSQLVFSCEACGFRHTDFFLGRTREPLRFTYEASKEEDLNVRVVRSTSGTIRIPELGVLIEPGPASDAYVSNIEGVLVRVEAVVAQLLRDAETQDVKQACEERLAQLASARSGRFAFTFILEDPYGNSALVHEKARVEAIPSEEAAQLKTGEYTLQLQEGLQGQGGNGHGDHRDG